MIQEDAPRTTNDIAKTQLAELLRSTSLRTSQEAQSVLQHQDVYECNIPSSYHYQLVSTCGWALRARKLGKRMSKKVKMFIEQLWLDSVRNNARITSESIQEQIRMKRDFNGSKFFSTNEYPTKNQINYQFRKLSQKYDLSIQQQLIAEIVEENTESQ